MAIQILISGFQIVDCLNETGSGRVFRIPVDHAALPQTAQSKQKKEMVRDALLLRWFRVEPNGISSNREVKRICRRKFQKKVRVGTCDKEAINDFGMITKATIRRPWENYYFLMKSSSNR